jgi:hypothetical protein
MTYWPHDDVDDPPVARIDMDRYTALIGGLWPGKRIKCRDIYDSPYYDSPLSSEYRATYWFQIVQDYPKGRKLYDSGAFNTLKEASEAAKAALSAVLRGDLNKLI